MTMKRILPLVAKVPTGPVPSVIAELESALADARNGDLVAVMIAGVTPNQELVWQRCDNGRWAQLLAAVACAGYDMLAQNEE